jgi:hypothetical protein
MTGQPSAESEWHESPSGKATESQHGMFERPTGLSALPEVVVYDEHDYGGTSHRTNLNFRRMSKEMNDKIASIVVVRGTWRFYRDSNYTGDYWDLDVGYYPTLGSVSHLISSFQCIKY